MDSPHVQEKIHIILHRHVQINILLRIMDGLNMHYITPFSFCNVVRWYEHTKITWMDYLLQTILH